MGVCYKKLFKLLIDKNMKKTELANKADFSLNTLSKLSKNEYVSMSVIVKICNVLDCTPNDILDIVHDNQ